MNLPERHMTVGFLLGLAQGCILSSVAWWLPLLMVPGWFLVGWAAKMLPAPTSPRAED